MKAMYIYRLLRLLLADIEHYCFSKLYFHMLPPCRLNAIGGLAKTPIRRSLRSSPLHSITQPPITLPPPFPFPSQLPFQRRGMMLPSLQPAIKREHLRNYDMDTTDDNTDREERKHNSYTPYAGMTRQQKDCKIGFRVESVAPGTIEASELLESLRYRFGGNAAMETKEKVFNHITEYLGVAGYPTGAIPDFNEAHINHLAYTTIIPVLRDFICRAGCKNMRLRFEKEIVDDGLGCTNEFVLVDLAPFPKEKFVLMVEVMGSSLGGTMSQCLLSLKDMQNSNGGGEVYGFITTGTEWQMIRYDGKFQITEGMQVLFPRMDENKELWMKRHSILVDCLNVALDRGGVAKGDRR